MNVGLNLAKDIPDVSKQFSDFLGSSPTNSLALFLTNFCEVIDHINQLKNKSSSGSHGIPNNIIKK